MSRALNHPSPPSPASAGAELENSTPAHIFRKEGEYWTIIYDGVVCRLRDSKGLQHLAYLMRQPGVKVPVLQLVEGQSPEASGQGLQRHQGRETRDPGPRTGDRKPRTGDSGPWTGAQSQERARLTVTKGIKAALTRIEAAHPTLAQHLQATIHRGYLCSYVPDPRLPIAWET